jgi:uncharacterized phage-associated protein
MIRDIDVAAYIYGRSGWMDSWKLQKLTYYAQSWSLAWTGRPLFQEPIQAWDDGPVAPHLYRVNKHEAGPMSTQLPGAAVENLHPDAVKIVDSILDFYGQQNREALIELTHGEAPWRDAYAVCRNTEISRRAMLRFYTKLSAIGGAVPDRPDLGLATVSTDRLETRAAYLQQKWADTLALLAQ